MKKLLLASIGIGTLLCMPAMAADLGKERAPILKAPPKVAVFTWTGCYLGLHGGYGWGNSNNDAGTFANPIADETRSDFSSKPLGGIAGGQLGCNYQSENWVVGVEGEGWRSWMKATTTAIGNEDIAPDPHSLRAQNMWDAALSLRLGAAVGRALFYVKGGGAYGSFQYTFIDAADFHDFDVNSTKFGWLFGGGIEYAFTDNLTAKVEYDYLNFGTNNVSTFLIASERNGQFAGGGRPYAFSVTETKNIVKVGLNLKF